MSIFNSSAQLDAELGEDGRFYNRFWFSICFVVCLLNLIIFPFYVYVFKTNRAIDKEIPIFPFVNRFYNVIRLFQLFNGCMCTVIIFIIFAYALQTTFLVYLTLTVMILVVFSGILVLIGISEAFNILLFLLTVTRAVMYSWPSTEKSVKTVLFYTHKRFHYLYIASITKMSISFVLLLHILLIETNIWYIVAAFVSIQVSLHVLIFVSGILYIPILISIRKLSLVASVQQNNPERYILWQFISVLIFKLMTLPFVIIGIWSYALLVVIIPLDCFLLPIIVQISYLGCNKRNVKTLITSFRLKKVMQVLFDRQTSVSPYTITNQSTRF